jgi:hypothetical protein
LAASHSPVQTGQALTIPPFQWTILLEPKALRRTNARSHII